MGPSVYKLNTRGTVTCPKNLAQACNINIGSDLHLHPTYSSLTTIAFWFIADWQKADVPLRASAYQRERR